YIPSLFLLVDLEEFTDFFCRSEGLQGPLVGLHAPDLLDHVHGVQGCQGSSRRELCSFEAVTAEKLLVLDLVMENAYLLPTDTALLFIFRKQSHDVLSSHCPLFGGVKRFLLSYPPQYPRNLSH